MTEPEDLAPSAADERESWNSVAAAWRKWWPKYEAAAHSLNEHLVELAGVASGFRILDVATGVGEPALTAARKAGAQGRVVATDFSREMLQIARERALSANLSNVTFRQVDANELAFPDASFDAALSRWALMLLPDPARAAGRVRASLVRGARFAAAVWSGPDDVPVMSLPRRVLQRECGIPPADPASPGPFSLSSPSALYAVFETAGFERVKVEPYRVVFTFRSPTEYTSFLLEVSSWTRKRLMALPGSTRADVIAHIQREAESRHGRRGELVFENRGLCGVGTA